MSSLANSWPFMDVANDVGVHLHTDEPVCTKCQWNGRISGAWFLDALAEMNADSCECDDAPHGAHQDGCPLA